MDTVSNSPITNTSASEPLKFFFSTNIAIYRSQGHNRVDLKYEYR